MEFYNSAGNYAIAICRAQKKAPVRRLSRPRCYIYFIWQLSPPVSLP